MDNNLIKSETTVYYTVSVNNESYVRGVEFYSGRVEKVDLRPLSEYKNPPWKAPNKEVAIKVAQNIGGKITKHTRTEVVTEITEKIHVIKEEAK